MPSLNAFGQNPIDAEAGAHIAVAHETIVTLSFSHGYSLNEEMTRSLTLALMSRRSTALTVHVFAGCLCAVLSISYHIYESFPRNLHDRMLSADQVRSSQKVAWAHPGGLCFGPSSQRARAAPL